MGGLWRAFTQSTAGTDPQALDPGLRGRTYAIPFDRVWTAALELADGGLPRWRVVSADDEAGIIEAEARSLVLRVLDDVRIDLGLDENAQTRVDLRAAARKDRADLGRSPRTIRKFLRKLDQALDARPEQILDARQAPTWTA